MILRDSGQDDTARILALGNKDTLPFLHDDFIFDDGTFDVAPLVFCQLCTVHCRIGNSYPPCIYFLLQTKFRKHIEE